ncbi:MAG: fatty acid desaturase [Myxococcota bacterium]
MVHHAKSDQPGDPYNPEGGFLYCFLADAIHQPIAHDLDEANYRKTCKFVAHTGMSVNSYEQYQYWGTLAHPLKLWSHQLLNWSFWFGVFFVLGGLPLVCALFGGACVWALGVRTFNYGAHGGGEDRRRDGEDFSRDRSINELWPGLVAGERHSNHHLYPSSERSGFRPWQIDLPYLYVRLLHALGGVSHYHDGRDHFYRKHYLPWLRARGADRQAS